MTTDTKAILLSDVPDSSEVWHKVEVRKYKTTLVEAYFKPAGFNRVFHMLTVVDGVPGQRSLMDLRYLPQDIDGIPASQSEAEMCEVVKI
jgi:hypothetical protein